MLYGTGKYQYELVDWTEAEALCFARAIHDSEKENVNIQDLPDWLSHRPLEEQAAVKQGRRYTEMRKQLHNRTRPQPNRRIITLTESSIRRTINEARLPCFEIF